MRLGVLGGFLTGTILSGVVLGTVSVLTYPTAAVPPAVEQVDVPAGSEFRQSREDTQAALPEADETPGAGTVPQVAPPEPDDLSSLEGADIAPGQQPQTPTPDTSLEAPPQPEATGLDVDTEEPVLPSPQALAPEAPDSEGALSISTEPAQPPQPPVEEQSAFPPPEPEISQPPAQPAAPEADPSESAALTPAPEDEPGQDQVAAMDAPEPEDTAPSGTIGNLAEGVTTNRLPSVSDGDSAGAADQPLPPLVRFAAPFDNPEGKPLMSIVLIDDGSSPISHEALADFPYPISYAVDASWPGAAEAAARYRAAGLEVLAMADLPDGATAFDAEIAMQAYLSAVPEAVAVMEGTRTGLQSSREAARQLAPILLESGHGLVLFSEGLDTVEKLISREGVPVATVFRDVDSSDQNAAAIRRFLDQAAFRAGQQEGGVVMVGRLRGETVSALLLWGLQDRASSVALAPVSAILTEE